MLGDSGRDERRRLDARQIARNSNIPAFGELLIKLAAQIHIGRVAVELESAGSLPLRGAE
jgi:hypothetical protein